MSLSIIGHNLEVTPALRDYVTNKLGRINRHFDSIISTHVILFKKPVQHTAEVTLRVAGKDLHCSVTADSMYAAIDLLADKLHRQIVKTKAKAYRHPHTALKRLVQPAVAL